MILRLRFGPNILDLKRYSWNILYLTVTNESKKEGVEEGIWEIRDLKLKNLSVQSGDLKLVIN